MIVSLPFSRNCEGRTPRSAYTEAWVTSNGGCALRGLDSRQYVGAGGALAFCRRIRLKQQKQRRGGRPFLLGRAGNMALPAEHPPKARLVLRVGITGHRPNKLGGGTDFVRDKVCAALTAIKEVLDSVNAETRELGCYSSEPPLLRIVSALAEGADQIAADASKSAARPWRNGWKRSRASSKRSRIQPLLSSASSRKKRRT
jgi:hypothetical protein